MAILRSYASLRVDGALVRLLVGEFISSIGDWLYLVALLVVVYERSNDATLLGIVGAARVLPYVVFSVPAGYIADHYDRRLVLLSTDIARGTIMVALAILVAVDGPLWAIVALSILATCFSSFFGPTIGAFLPTLVGDESRLGPANSAWASLDNLAFIVGPAVGGLLIAASGLSLAFALNAISFAVVAVVLWRLPRGRRTDEPSAAAAEPGSAEEPSTSVLAAAERRYLVPLLGLGTLNVVSSFAFGGLSILTVVLAGSAFGANEAATGYLNAAIGVGGVVGAILAGGLVLRPRLAPALTGGAVLLAVGLTVLGFVGSLGPALVGMAVASAGSLTVEVVDATIFQRIVPDAVRGRALGVIATVATLAYAAGAFAVPTLAGPVGVGGVLIGSAVAVVIAAVVSAILIGSAGTRAPDPDETILRRVAGLPVFAGVGPAQFEADPRAAAVPRHHGRRGRHPPGRSGRPLLRDPRRRVRRVAHRRSERGGGTSANPRARRCLRRARAAHGNAAIGDRRRPERGPAPRARGCRLPRTGRQRARPLVAPARPLPRCSDQGAPRREHGRPGGARVHEGQVTCREPDSAAVARGRHRVSSAEYPAEDSSRPTHRRGNGSR